MADWLPVLLGVVFVLLPLGGWVLFFAVWERAVSKPRARAKLRAHFADVANNEADRKLGEALRGEDPRWLADMGITPPPPPPPKKGRRTMSSDTDSGKEQQGESVAHPLGQLVEALKADVEGLGGRWTSSRLRAQENPPSAAVHFVLGGKRYVGVLQPLDLDDRAGQ
jgi:hypothetical protein